MKNKIFFIILLFFIFNFKIIYANGILDTCNNTYKEKFLECKEAISQNNFKQITEFICKNQEDINIMAQIILDLQFKEIDLEVEEYLAKLEEEKDRFFGPNASETEFDALLEIDEKLGFGGYFYNKYIKSCGTNNGSVIVELFHCFGVLNPKNINSYFNTTICTNLIANKLNIYRKVSSQILKQNKIQIDKDIKKLFVQDQRKKTDFLIDLMNINISYLKIIYSNLRGAGGFSKNVVK